MNIRIALAGNPNSGKTTLFNALTGSSQYVGNWPGVTVEKKEGRLKKDSGAVLVDLPGVYSLSPYTQEEVIARDYLLQERPDVLINIVDGTNLERNLYLTTQLAELGIPMVIAVNRADIMQKRGESLHIDKFQSLFGCEAVSISALKETGMDALMEAVGRAKKAPKPLRFSPAVEEVLHKIEQTALKELPDWQKRWASVKLFERDETATVGLFLPEDTLQRIETEIAQVEEERADDSESIITGERYDAVTDKMEQLAKSRGRVSMTMSDKIDRIVTNRWLGLPIFALIMMLVYYVSITTVGTAMTDWVNDGLFGDGWHLFGNGTAAYEEAVTGYAEEHIWTPDWMREAEAAAAAEIAGAEEIVGAAQEKDFGAFEEAYEMYAPGIDEAGFSLTEPTDAALEEAPDPADYGQWIPGIPVVIGNALEAVNAAAWLQGMIVDGIVAGVGAVLGFLPQMLTLFLCLAILEECGYMARVAFVMDRVFRRFGLSGKSFIPILIGTGCAVPGIMASRTIESENDRRMTILTTSFIPCSAKIPIIALIAAALFGGAWWVAPSAYFIGMGAIILTGIMLKKTRLFSGHPTPFVMEFPEYHWPAPASVLRTMGERGGSFIKRAGTIILLSSVVIWAGSKLGFVDGQFMFSNEMALEQSLLGIAGNAVSGIFVPLGFGTIKATVATVMGLVAKEEVVAVFGILDFTGLTAIAAYSFLIFNLLCAPCFAAIGAIRREMNSAKWTAFAILYQCGLAYAVSLIFYQFAMLFTGQGNAIGVIAALAVLAVLAYYTFRPAERTPHLKPALQSK